MLAPMGGAVTPALAAAVSNAGGLGMLPLTWTPPDEIAAMIDETRQRTQRPFRVDLGLAWDQRERLAAALAAGVRIVSFLQGRRERRHRRGARGSAQLFSSPLALRRKDEPRLPRAPTSFCAQGGKPADMCGEPSRHSRSSHASSMQWHRCQ